MPTLLETEVRPGDVISSDLFQSMIRKLAELDQRVASLESLSGGDTGEPLILAIEPPNQQRVGRELSLSGVNFVVPANANKVTVAGVAVTEFLAGSTSALLRFIIPSGVTVGPSGQDIELRVTNANGSHAVLYHVLPRLPVTGNPPVFTAIVKDDGTGQPLAVGQFFHIRGANFADRPGDNQISFLVTTQAGSVTYPRTGERIEIDEAASSPTLIRAQLPDFAEAPPLTPIPVTLELRVGAHPPTTQQIQVVRLP